MSDPRLSIIPAGAVLDPRIKARDLQVLCLFGRHIDRRGWCRRSQVQMAKEMGCARSTVQASIDRLVEAGWLQKKVLSAPHQQGERDSAHEYRVVLDVPDQPQDVVDTPADISAPLPTQSRHPLPTHGSAPINDPCLTTSSLRSERGREPFDEIWEVFPRNPQSSEISALHAFNELSGPDQLAAIEGAQHFAAWFREEAGRRKEPLSDRLSFAPSLNRWLRNRGWIEAMTLKVKARPNSDASKLLESVEYVDRVAQPGLFQACERVRGKAVPDLMQRFAFDKSIVEQVRQSESAH